MLTYIINFFGNITPAYIFDWYALNNNKSKKFKQVIIFYCNIFSDVSSPMSQTRIEPTYVNWKTQLLKCSECYVEIVHILTKLSPSLKHYIPRNFYCNNTRQKIDIKLLINIVSRLYSDLLNCVGVFLNTFLSIKVLDS